MAALLTYHVTNKDMDVERLAPVTVISTHPVFALSLINKAFNIDTMLPYFIEIETSNICCTYIVLLIENLSFSLVINVYMNQFPHSSRDS